jgi:uncharacterized protein
MSLKEQIQADLKAAMKEKRELELQVLRMLNSAIHNLEISKQAELTDEDVQGVVKKEVKSRKESIDSFKQAGREESAQKEAEEMKILEKYLPEMMSEEEVTKLIEEEIANNPEANQGQIIGAVMQKVGSQADGGMVSQIVRDKLSS